MTTTHVDGSTAGAAGETVHALHDAGLISDEQISQAVELAAQRHQTPLQVLLDTGAVTRTDVVRTAARSAGLNYVDLTEFTVNASAAALLAAVPPMLGSFTMDSGAGATASSTASYRRPGAPRVVNQTCWPGSTWPISASEISANTSIRVRSPNTTMVGADCAALTVCPCWAVIARTVPSLGAVMRV